ncbi:Hypothetical protein FKW44_001348, partial [Caligus rogercresseyi]
NSGNSVSTKAKSIIMIRCSYINTQHSRAANSELKLRTSQIAVTTEPYLLK